MRSLEEGERRGHVRTSGPRRFRPRLLRDRRRGFSFFSMSLASMTRFFAPRHFTSVHQVARRQHVLTHGGDVCLQWMVVNLSVHAFAREGVFHGLLLLVYFCSVTFVRTGRSDRHSSGRQPWLLAAAPGDTACSSSTLTHQNSVERRRHTHRSGA